jgi:hypothetical protein
MSATLALVILSFAIVLGWGMASPKRKAGILGVIGGRKGSRPAAKVGADTGTMLDAWRRGGVL